MHTKWTVYGCHDHRAEVWLGGDSPWAPALEAGSQHNEAISDSNARVWLGKTVVRTTELHHEQRTSFLLGTPSHNASGCSVDQVAVIARCRAVRHTVHCCMALRGLEMANVQRFAKDPLAPGDDVIRWAIRGTLHEHRTGCLLGKDGSPDGEETSCLFAAWPHLALLLAMRPDESLYKVVVSMAQMLPDLYHTYQVGPAPQCRATAAAYREHCAPRFLSNYPRFLGVDADRLLEDIWRFGTAMLSIDIVQSLDRLLKQAVNEHIARGNGKQKATRQIACGCPEASMHSHTNAPGANAAMDFTSTCMNLMFFAMCLVFPRLPCSSYPILHTPSLSHFCPLLHHVAEAVNNAMLGMLTALIMATQNMQLVVCYPIACMHVNMCIIWALSHSRVHHVCIICAL